MPNAQRLTGTCVPGQYPSYESRIKWLPRSICILLAAAIEGQAACYWGCSDSELRKCIDMPTPDGNGTKVGQPCFGSVEKGCWCLKYNKPLIESRQRCYMECGLSKIRCPQVCLMSTRCRKLKSHGQVCTQVHYFGGSSINMVQGNAGSNSSTRPGTSETGYPNHPIPCGSCSTRNNSIYSRRILEISVKHCVFCRLRWTSSWRACTAKIQRWTTGVFLAMGFLPRNSSTGYAPRHRRR